MTATVEKAQRPVLIRTKSLRRYSFEASHGAGRGFVFGHAVEGGHGAETAESAESAGGTLDSGFRRKTDGGGAYCCFQGVDG